MNVEKFPNWGVSKETWQRRLQRAGSDRTPQGVAYHWELAGPQGAHYYLLREPGQTDEQIEEAAEYLRRAHDVLNIWWVDTEAETEPFESQVRTFVDRLLEDDEAPKTHMTPAQKQEVQQFAEQLWQSLEGADLEKAEELTEGDIPLDDRWPKHFTQEQRQFGHRLVWAWYDRIIGRA